VKTRLLILALGFAIVASAAPLLAHHSWPVDTGREVTVKGTVTGYNWTNPHVMIGLNVETANGKTEKWDVGGPSTARMSGNGWNNSTLVNGGELKFRTEGSATIPGQGTLAVVARSRPNPAFLTQREQRTMLSGVSFSDLRRIAIDKMINAGGWVINDYERQVNGARVFVVIAQTPSEGRSPEKAWNFYFAEVDGKIYSLTLNTPLEFSNKLTDEGEKFISSLTVKAITAAQPANK